MNINIIGTGIFSLALALNIADNLHSINMWSENEELVTNFNQTHELPSLTTNPIPSNITLTNDISESISNSDLIIIATSAKYVRPTLENLKLFYTGAPICIASKGIENDTGLFLSEVIADILQTEKIAVISGPTFAIDLINKQPSALTLATLTPEIAPIITKALENKNLKLKTISDIKGTQALGSIKNVFAIASGILTGLNFPESTLAFYLTEVINALRHLLTNLKLNPDVVLSYAGIGDLLLTCTSPKSRNFKYGELIGEKKSPQELAEYLTHNTTEGYYTLLSMKKFLQKNNTHLPLIDIIYDIVINHQNPDTLTKFLLTKN